MIRDVTHFVNNWLMGTSVDFVDMAVPLANDWLMMATSTNLDFRGINEVSPTTSTEKYHNYILIC
jgi:hypothetical protein